MRWFGYKELDTRLHTWREVRYSPAKNVIKNRVHLADDKGLPLCGSRLAVNDLEPVSEDITCERCLARVKPVRDAVRRYDHALFKEWEEG